MRSPTAHTPAASQQRELIQFHAPAGTRAALDELAKASNRKRANFLRVVVLDLIAAANNTDGAGVSKQAPAN